MAVLELVYGWISNSIGLISDSAHMVFDSTALGVGVYASYKASLPPSYKYSYGYASRVDILKFYSLINILIWKSENIL